MTWVVGVAAGGRGSSFSIISFAFSYCLWGSQGKNAEWYVPSPVNHILSKFSTMTCPSWVALHSMGHSFIELGKVVVHVICLVSFLWLWFSFCLPSDGPWIKVNWKWSNKMAGVNINILVISELKWTGMEWTNLIQMTIISTTVGKNPLEEME